MKEKRTLKDPYEIARKLPPPAAEPNYTAVPIEAWAAYKRLHGLKVERMTAEYGGVTVFVTKETK